MKKLSLLVPAILLVCVLSNRAQEAPSAAPRMSPPPTSMNPDNVNPRKDSPTLPRHIDLVQLQKDADELARTAQTIPSDVADVRRGLMPKDVLQKLKQIEKMSKHLRSQLSQ